MSLVGISERKLLECMNVHFDDLIIQKIIYEYLYPKLPYLEEILHVSKYYKLAHFIDSYHYYDVNKASIIELINYNDTSKTCKFGSCDYFKTFRDNHYFDEKECIINVMKTFKYNDFDSLENMKNDIIYNTNNITKSLHSDEDKLQTIIFIDSSLMMRGYKKLLTNMYEFGILMRTFLDSQREYMYVLDTIEGSLDDYLIQNDKDIIDKTYEEKVDMFMKL